MSVVGRRMMWAAGAVAAMSSITFPAISAIVSRNADPDQQGKLWPDCFCQVYVVNCGVVNQFRVLTCADVATTGPAAKLTLE